MFNKFNGIVTNDIEQFENILHMELPKDYKDFLIKNNGGQFVDDIHYFMVDELGEKIGMDVLFGFNQVRSLCLNSWFNEYCDELPENTIIIGNSLGAGLIILIWQDDWQGVFLWDHCLELEQSSEDDCLYRISDNFELFIESLDILSE